MLSTFILLYLILTRIYKFDRADTLKALLIASLVPLLILLVVALVGGGFSTMEFLVLILF